MTRRFLPSNERVMTITSYPRLGVSGDFSTPSVRVDPANFTLTSSHSLFLPEEIISPNPKFP